MDFLLYFMVLLDLFGRIIQNKLLWKVIIIPRYLLMLVGLLRFKFEDTEIFKEIMKPYTPNCIRLNCIDYQYIKFSSSKFSKKQAWKCFQPLSAMSGIGYFRNLGNFLLLIWGFFGNSLRIFSKMFEIGLSYTCWTSLIR